MNKRDRDQQVWTKKWELTYRLTGNTLDMYPMKMLLKARRIYSVLFHFIPDRPVIYGPTFYF